MSGRSVRYLNKILPSARGLKYDRDITVDRAPHQNTTPIRFDEHANGPLDGMHVLDLSQLDDMVDLPIVERARWRTARAS